MKNYVVVQFRESSQFSLSGHFTTWAALHGAAASIVVGIVIEVTAIVDTGENMYHCVKLPGNMNVIASRQG